MYSERVSPASERGELRDLGISRRERPLDCTFWPQPPAPPRHTDQQVVLFWEVLLQANYFHYSFFRHKR
jgi:hypothetical protein